MSDERFKNLPCHASGRFLLKRLKRLAFWLIFGNVSRLLVENKMYRRFHSEAILGESLLNQMLCSISTMVLTLHEIFAFRMISLSALLLLVFPLHLLAGFLKSSIFQPLNFVQQFHCLVVQQIFFRFKFSIVLVHIPLQ